MPSYPGGSSHDNTSSDKWSSLATYMVQVESIMKQLDNYDSHMDFTDGTMRNFVTQLNRIKDTILRNTPSADAKKTTPMVDHLRNACQSLNLAAIEYQKKKSLTTTSYNHLSQARKHLSDVLTLWQRIRKAK